MKSNRWWAWWRRQPQVRDLTGPATIYRNQTGAYATSYRPNLAPAWDEPTTVLPQAGTFLTPGEEWRSGGWRT